MKSLTTDMLETDLIASDLCLLIGAYIGLVMFIIIALGIIKECRGDSSTSVSSKSYLRVALYLGVFLLISLTGIFGVSLYKMCTRSDDTWHVDTSEVTDIKVFEYEMDNRYHIQVSDYDKYIVVGSDYSTDFKGVSDGDMVYVLYDDLKEEPVAVYQAEMYMYNLGVRPANCKRVGADMLVDGRLKRR